MDEADYLAEAYGADHKPADSDARRWPVWGWVLFVLGTLLITAVSLVAGAVAIFGNSTTCNGEPSTYQVANGQRDLLFIAFFAILPACAVAIFVRPRIRLIIAALICAAPPLVFWMVNRSDPNAYSGSFCF